MANNENTEQIATIIHISDLHFSDTICSDKALYEECLANIASINNGAHCYQRVSSLSKRINEILSDRKESSVPSIVVCTGDITHSGEEGEFIVAFTFLRKNYETGDGYIGLNLGDNINEINLNSCPRLVCVPGNHDIWQRKHPNKLAAYESFFPSPFPKTWQLQTRGRTIFFHGLNSCQGTLLDHKFACGQIRDQQLDQACDKIKQVIRKDRESIHIVCMHHPLIESEKNIGIRLMDLKESAIVAKRLYALGVDLVLSGHFHQTFYRSSETDMPNYAVAGTATQLYSDNNFLLFDIWNDKIRMQVIEYDKNWREFKFNPYKEHTFMLSVPVKGYP